MANEKFYPSINTLVKVDALPDQLGFVKDGISQLLGNLYYRDLQFSKSTRGDSAQYNLSIVSLQRIDIEIPGTGIFLVLNPSFQPNSTSVFPVSLNYEWPILGYVRGLNLNSFSFNAADVYDLALKVLGITEVELINRVLGIFISAPTPINQFVDDINGYFSAIINGYNAIPYPSSGNPVQEVVTAIKTHPQISNTGQNISFVIFTLYLLDSLSEGNTKDKVNAFFSGFFHAPTEEFIKKLITPKIEASLQLAVGIEFPRSILTPLDPNGDPRTDPNDKSMLIFSNTTNPTFSFSTEKGIGYDVNLGASLNYPSQIGNTGFTIDIQNAKLDISREVNIPEADADGRPKDFVGVYIGQVDIGLPKFFSQSNNPSTTTIKGRGLIIGTGGISGTIGFDNPNGVVSAKIGGFEIALNAFFLRLHQNQFIESEIKATLEITGFKDSQTQQTAKIDIDVHIASDGDFEATASVENGFPAIEIPNILKLTVNSLSVGRKDTRFFVEIAGLLDFIATIPGLSPDSMPKGLDIKKIIIWDDGQIELDGGTIILPKAVSLKIPPVNLSITAMGAGSHEQMYHNVLRKYKFFEFSGGIGVHPGGVDVRGDGVQFFFTHDSIVGDDDFFVRIKGIGIDLVIPGSADADTAALIISGFLSMKNPTPDQNNPNQPTQGSDADTEYAGGITFSLPRAKISGSAAMRLRPKLPAFIIDLGLELPTPIPLGSTGLGIYGFRGLVGQRYVVSKTQAGLSEQDEWWRYYKAKVAQTYQEGIVIDKFAAEDGFSIGAGVSLATTTDSGKSLSTKLFLLLSLPEVFLLQGQAAILKERIGLDSTIDPPFFALIAITNHSVEAAFGVNYLTPESTGKVSNVTGMIEMGFFFGNSGAWYINIGKDQPVERRIQARIVSLFNAYAYLMLSSSGLRTGAGASWQFSKGFGPVAVELGAYIDVAGRINFFNNTAGVRHVQLGGSIQMGGYARIRVFKFKFGFSIAASLAAEAPKPFIVSGSVTISIDLPKPFHDIDVDIEFTWTFDSSLNGDHALLVDFTQPLQKQPARAVNVLTKETYEVLYLQGAPTTSLANTLLTTDDFTVPLDSRIDVEFFKGVLPDTNTLTNSTPNIANINKFGGLTLSPTFTDAIPSQPGKSPQVIHEYRVKNIQVKSWNSSAWVDYDVYAAITPQQLATFVNQTVLATLKWGYWQHDDPNKYTKLGILAQDPLTFLNGNSPEEFGVGPEDIFCPPALIEETCVDFTAFTPAVVPVNTLELVQDKLLIRITGQDGKILSLPNPYNLPQVLQLEADSQLEIFFPAVVSFTELKLVTKAPQVQIAYYNRIPVVDNTNQPVLDSSGKPTYQDQLVHSDTILQKDLAIPVIYNDLANPINKVVITAGNCTQPDNIVCDTAVTPLAAYLESFLDLLAQNGDLVNTNLNLGANPQYKNAFCKTPLYSGTSTSCGVNYTAAFTATVLNAALDDGKGYACKFSLELINPSGIFDFAKVTHLVNLRHDPSHIAAGTHYDFLVTARIPSGVSFINFELKGTSECWPISYCHIVDFLLEEGGGYLKQEDDGRIIIDDDDSDACSTLIYKICWLSLEDALSNANTPSLSNIQTDNQAMVNGINLALHPVWRPETVYAITVTTEDKIASPGSVAGSHTVAHTFGFRTRGTIGHFHQHRSEYNSLAAVDKGDQFKLSSLKYYIDYAKSYPNANGDILNAKPLFYKNPRLLLFYVKDYVYQMLSDWGAYNGNDGVDIRFETVIRDPIEPPANTATSIAASFVTHNAPIISPNTAILNNMLEDNNPCSGVSGPLQPIGITSVIQMPDSFLKPLKLYTAIFNTKTKFSTQPVNQFVTNEVHRYNFQTSRYATFKEQVESYILSTDINDPRSAIFTMEQGFDPNDIAEAIQVVNNTLQQDDELISEFAESFDRLMDGALKMGALPAAVTTEFNIIKDSTSGNIIGILIRNPEPFNDPKIPPGIISQSLSVAVGNLNTDAGMTVLFSKDRSKMFITNAAMTIGPGQYFFTFGYFEFSGTAYNAVDTEIVQLSIS